MTSFSLETKSISWNNTQNNIVLHETSFAVKPRTILGVVGANGAGKTTLLRLLYQYYKPSTGSIFIDGRNTSKMSLKEVARNIAVVVQEQPVDFSLSVKEIISLGRIPHRRHLFNLDEYDKVVIENVISKLQLQSFSKRVFSTLSGGEKQLVMIARALAQEPKILILDELTNHLDIRHQLEVLKIIINLNITVITSLHDLNIALKYADNIIMLSKGRSIAFGSPNKVLTKKHIATAFNVVATNKTLLPCGESHLTFNL